MFLTEAKSTVTQALKNVFDAGYPVPQFQDLHIDIEYPNDITDYPGIWVDMEIVGNLTKAGIDEFAEVALDSVTNDAYALYKWRYQGYSTFTIAALHSLERDRLFDEVVRVFAFSNSNFQVQQFRSFIENNPLIAMNMDFDNIAVRGMSAAPGTPWGTNDVIYEVTLAMETVGEFVSDEQGQTLYPISGVELAINVVGETPPQDQRLLNVGVIPPGTPAPSSPWL